MRTVSEIYLAGGCFWGAEKYLSSINGVTKTEVGYANGCMQEPTYEQVCTGKTDFAESVRVEYDKSILSTGLLLEIFYSSIDPTTLNKQGNDIGTQYRTGIYYTNDTDREEILKSLENLAKKHKKPIVIEAKRLENFYLAEEYHQKYLDKNPSGYCHIDNRLFNFARMANQIKPQDESERDTLTSMQRYVTMENGTEPPFDNEYHNEFRRGIYVDITNGKPLFVSSKKFDAGCGWPSFSQPIVDDLLIEKEDFKIAGRPRTEVRAKESDIHLGHVFDDGPQELGGLRYCINSAALRFVPLEEMQDRGYGDFIDLVE